MEVHAASPLLRKLFERELCDRSDDSIHHDTAHVEAPTVENDLLAEI